MLRVTSKRVPYVSVIKLRNICYEHGISLGEEYGLWLRNHMSCTQMATHLVDRLNKANICVMVDIKGIEVVEDA